MTDDEILEFITLLVIYVCHSLIVFLCHCSAFLLESRKFWCTPVLRTNACRSLTILEHICYYAAIEAICDVTTCGNSLQLRGSLIDRENTCITIETLTSIFEHEARTTMHLNTIVSILVSIL